MERCTQGVTGTDLWLATDRCYGEPPASMHNDGSVHPELRRWTGESQSLHSRIVAQRTLPADYCGSYRHTKVSISSLENADSSPGPMSWLASTMLPARYSIQTRTHSLPRRPSKENPFCLDHDASIDPERDTRVSRRQRRLWWTGDGEAAAPAIR